MSKQDRQAVRTAQDLERKYDLSSIEVVKKATKNSEQGINQTNKKLEDFMSATLKSVQSLQDQIDGKVETWFYDGVPTLSNLPASTWKTEEDKNNHLKDLYYDRTTGYAYVFSLINGTYQWSKNTDIDVVQALAIANTASDTADSKRRVFVVQPAPPYDNGDLWVRNNELYICQVSKKENEAYEDKDFIVATKYTDDTLAIQVGDNLEVVRGTVTTIQENVDSFKIEMETTVKSIDELQQETIESLEQMSYTFGTNDLVIAKSTDPVNARINNQGLKVYNYNELNAIFNHRGTGVQKLIVIGDAQLANISIVKGKDRNGNAVTDFNHLVSNFQTLSDLEG